MIAFPPKPPNHPDLLVANDVLEELTEQVDQCEEAVAHRGFSITVVQCNWLPPGTIIGLSEVGFKIVQQMKAKANQKRNDGDFPP